MSNTLKFGNGNFATKDGSVLAYNDLNNNFKPLPFDFSRGSTATVVNKEGLIETVGTNEPRIDFKDDSKGAMLLEPSRTNLFTYSENIPQQFAETSITDTFEYGLAPNGTQKSTRLQLTSLGASRYADTITSIVTSETTYTFTCYYKGILGETAYMYVLVVGGASVEKEITFTGEWQREQVTFTAGSSTNLAYIVDTRKGGNASDFEVWGAQLEQGSYPTSYIPTQGGVVTRLAESCNNGGNEQVINSIEGVLYVEMKNDIVQQQTISLFESNDNSVQLGLIHGNIRCAIGRSNQYVLGTVSPAFNYANGQINKYAIVWNGTSAKTFINGQLKNTITTPSPLNLKLLAMSNPLGSENMSGNIEDLRVYNTALTDQELQALTQV